MTRLIFTLIAAPTLGTACTYQPLELTRLAGDSSTDAGDAQPRYIVMATVNAPATGTVTLRLNDGDSVILVGSGQAVFGTMPLAPGTPYAVRVTMVSNGIGCGVTNGAGVMPAADVTDVVVSCAQVEVTPAHPNLPNWLDFVANDGDGIDNASGSVCSATDESPLSYYQCLNGGQLRVLSLPMFPSCDGLIAHDTRQIFVWRCVERGGIVQFRSFTLRPERGLADVFTSSGDAFAPLALIVNRDGAIVAKSEPAIWWTNPIVKIASTTTNLDGLAGTVYVVGQNLERAEPLIIDSSRIALVTLPGAALRGTAGYAASLVYGSGLVHIWLEGTYDLGGGGHFVNLMFNGVRYMTARNLTINGNRDENVDETSGLVLCGSTAGLFENIRSANNRRRGVLLDGGQRNTFRGLRIANTTDAADANPSVGLLLGDACGLSANNTFEDIVIANSAGQALASAAFTGTMNMNNRFIGLTVLGAGAAGVELSGHDLVANATLLNSNGIGLQALDRDGFSVMNLVAGGNGFATDGAGVRLGLTNDFTFHNLAVPQNGIGLLLEGVGYGLFTGALVIGGNSGGDCWTSPDSILPGLQDSTCVTTGISSAMLTTGADLNAALVLLPETDSRQPAMSTGTLAYDDIVDWHDFERAARGFARFSDLFPSADGLGVCGSGESCSLWDASCLAAQTPICAALPVPDADDVIRHVWSAANAVECSLIAGAEWVTGVCSHPGYATSAECTSTGTSGGVPGDWATAKCVSTFLQNAIELSNDLVGNDNGLCESNEHCLFTPNLGAYQGPGRLVSLGAVDGAVITGVTLWLYDKNGY